VDQHGGSAGRPSTARHAGANLSFDQRGAEAGYFVVHPPAHAVLRQRLTDLYRIPEMGGGHYGCECRWSSAVELWQQKQRTGVASHQNPGCSQETGAHGLGAVLPRCALHTILPPCCGRTYLLLLVLHALSTGFRIDHSRILLPQPFSASLRRCTSRSHTSDSLLRL
jgi:hypothetical protein